MTLTREFIRAIPKTDLHLHLDGSLRPETLLELAAEGNVALPANTVEGLMQKVFKEKYKDLGEYLQGFAYTVAVMQSEANLERVAYELAEDNIEEGVRYIEVRFAPQLHQSQDMDVIRVLQAVNRGLERKKKEFNNSSAVTSGGDVPFDYGLIVCAMRMFDYGFSEYFDTLLNVHKHSEKKWIFSLASQELVKASVNARNKYKIPIVGFDLAGQEKGYPASDHRAAYHLAHRNFLKKTVHAGEAYGPESIFQAITELYADRIGHGLHLFHSYMIQDRDIRDKEAYTKYLAEFIAHRRITIEVCLTSNLQTNPEFKELIQHPFKQMREAKLSVTLCTDNRTVSRTTVTDELIKAIDTFDISPKELRDFVIYGFKRSFFPGTYLEKRQYVRLILNHYEKLEQKFK